ncbi:oligopeptide/dipeptide ABC transporter, ATP-binding protein [Desulfosporosinus orientis DSM 765]|uniref:Oligopeptide/dipeptide ABC transporter, ATP-binding protein n=1 Tax=Desulfosporosinus orientis (strain ATCC 19365 / DSM 765 / NCIMB 8382 / VKM B-1628 / Singapore I) TaxID=768706 RepID=G7WE12_DESOD|nr:dipeptide ABC transporter ATP-binding protein [Desulfosporosinus orientis]AET69410.1 oligopeptide/dipeptide ABC transporter, ATP-binding protein [Desulfosporosinus orientis DSM 765]
METSVLAEVKHLKMYFQTEGSFSFRKKYIKAVDDVSFKLFEGETFGLVGESGCGKSTLGRTLLGLYQPNEGKVIFEGEDIFSLKSKRMKELRKKMQLIFQDPSASLNPRKTIADILNEPFHIHNVGSKEERQKKIKELLERVGLSAYYLSRYPHEMSGGQKQRVGIARALALNPKLIVCDEAVSALDVSIQAQVINLLEDLQQEYGFTYLFISHNLSVVHHICNRVGVMYLGKLVEIGNHEDIYYKTLHPYAKALISAIPHTDPDMQRERILLTGDVPSPADPPMGCRFHTRCPQAIGLCSQAEPALKEVYSGHLVACHRAYHP